jgi:hypothetical protein
LQLLKAFSIAALVYSIPMLLEVRLSPQFHRWVYGYFPHSFAQQIRYGGYRPVVFLEQGLQVALFAAMALVATIVLARSRKRVITAPTGLVAGYLTFVLLLCKTLGATVYALVAGPVVMFTRPRTWVKLSCALLLVVWSYPVLRTYNIIPVHHISAAANSISPDRSRSFDERVENEDLLLGKALQKPLFGWGTWGRNRVRDQYTGQDITVSDGGWIIEFGTFGWLGYFSLFGLFAVAGFRALRAVGTEVTTTSMAIGGASLLLAMNVVDAIPNSNLTPLTFALGGAIASAAGVRAKRSAVRTRKPAASSEPSVAAAPQS